MVEIITDDGLVLDLDPECVFEIEYDQPLLSDDRCPVPFTTPIGFLPTLTNKKAFGFLNAMMLDPANRQVKASMFFNGSLLMDGMLIYDSYEDGVINYSFSGRNIEDDWSAEIGSQIPKFISIIGPQGYSQSEAIDKIKNTTTYRVAAPPMVVQAAANRTIYPGTRIEVVEEEARYINSPYNSNTRFMPVFKVEDILSGIMKGKPVGQDMKESFSKLGIMGNYDPDHVSEMINFDASAMLPTISVYELIRDVAKMFCASVFADGKGYCLFSANEVLGSKEFSDWSQRVSDRYSLANEPGKRYKFGYKNSEASPKYNVSDLDHDIYMGNITRVNSYNDAADLAFPDCTRNDEGISSAVHAVTGEIFSGKMASVKNIAITACENVYDGNIPIDTSSSSEDEIFDNSVDLNLIKCVPDTIIDPKADTGVSGPFPIIEPSVSGEPAGKEAFIGIIGICQGRYKFTAFNRLQAFESAYDEIPSGNSLSPRDLFDEYHKAFALWMSKEKQVVTVDLDLDAPSLLHLKMYRKVYFNSRLWLPKSIKVVLSPSSDGIDATGEFIAM